MRTGKPCIAILMAVYEPRIDWLREQLESLERQSYPNLRLYVRDDCSPTVAFSEIRACVKECIRSFPYVVEQNEKNLGSNGTFERLTAEAEGEYFAYCDQDDIWLPEKLVVLQEALEREKALLACSDMLIIDGQGRQTADSITKVRRHHRFYSGEGLAEKLLFHNFVSGCAMLVRGETAKEAIPFCPYMVHDHYLALWCAEGGKLLALPERLIRYRIHGGNQTGVLAGVTDRESYRRLRIDSAYQKFRWLQEHYSCCESTRGAIMQGMLWSEARGKNWNRQGGGRTVWKYRRFSPRTSLFELVAVWMPKCWFMWIIELKRKNLL